MIKRNQRKPARHQKRRQKFEIFRAVVECGPLWSDVDEKKGPRKGGGDMAREPWDWERDDATTTGEAESTSVIPGDPRPDDEPATATAEPGEVFDPCTGELVSTDDIDGLADLLIRCRERRDYLYVAIHEAERAIVAKAPADDGPKTKRVKGKTKTLKIEHPSAAWDSGKLREAWEAYPDFRDEYLAISSIKPRIREVKKLKETSGEPPFLQFRSMVCGAEKAPTASARITIEKD